MTIAVGIWRERLVISPLIEPLPFRVLIVTPDFPPATGGVQVLMGELARRLVGMRVRVVTLAGPGAESFDRSAGLDVRRVRIGAGISRLRTVVLGLRACVEVMRLRPHAVLIGHVAASPVIPILRYLLRRPVVLYVHADEFRVWPSLCSFAVRHADAVIAVSRHSRTLAVNGGAAANVHVIFNGVGGRSDPLNAPERTQGPPTVITVARLMDRYKGHDVLMRAMPLILARVPDARWVVVGDGPLRPVLEDLAQTLGVRAAIEFTGRISDSERDDLLLRADVFAMPTRLPPGGVGGEGFGIVYLEAAAKGLPVVAGRDGAAGDSVDAGRSGILVDPMDHVAVAGAIADLLNDPARARSMGEAGRDWASRFSWDATAAQVSELLRALASSEKTVPK